MKILRFLFLPLFLASSYSVSADCCGGPGGAVTCPGGQESDYPIVMEVVNSKRSIPFKDKGPNFSLSGDIRLGWGHVTEKLNGKDLRSFGSAPARRGDPCTCIDKNGNCTKYCFPKNVYEVEYNLYVDYSCDRSWAVGWVAFDNAAGIDSTVSCAVDKEACRGSGCCENICLRKAYVGYNVVTNGCFRFDIEIGRRPLWSIFNSYIEFQNRFDGALVRLYYNISDNSDLYLNTGPFVIDERAHHYGYVGETGYLNIFNSGFDVLYSFISWMKHGPNRCGTNNAFGTRYADSQLQVNYWLDPDLLGVKVKLFGAGLINTDATPTVRTLGKKENKAWYLGGLFGQVCQAGDWSLNICYQYVEAQAIPDSDISGIGTGNVLNETFFLSNDPATARGFGNYQGWRFEGLYALSDNLSFDLLVEFSSPINKQIGGDHDFSLIRLQAIYAF